jgi:hypothetical protein
MQVKGYQPALSIPLCGNFFLCSVWGKPDGFSHFLRKAMNYPRRLDCNNQSGIFSISCQKEIVF